VLWLNHFDHRCRGWQTSPKNTVPADKNGPHPSPPEYRTVQQIDTVLSDKNCRAGRQIRPSSWGQPTLFETRVDESPAKAVIFGAVDTQKGIPYSPTSITVPPGKEYRTLRQALPYRPARNTVPPGKEYRTVRQNMAYSPAKVMRDVPANQAKTVGRPFVRPVIVSC
jgi:hypothetical protein